MPFNFNVRKYLRNRVEKRAAKALQKIKIKNEILEGMKKEEELLNNIEEAEKFTDMSGSAVMTLKESREMLQKEYPGIASDTMEYFKREITDKLKFVVNELEVPIGAGMSVEGKIRATERICSVKLRLRRQLRDLDDIGRMIRGDPEGRKRKMSQWRLVTVDEVEAKRMRSRNLAHCEVEKKKNKKVNKKKGGAKKRPKGILKKNKYYCN